MTSFQPKPEPIARLYPFSINREAVAQRESSSAATLLPGREPALPAVFEATGCGMMIIQLQADGARARGQQVQGRGIMNLGSWQTPTAGIVYALRCLRCGYAIKPGGRFCSQCGSPIGAVADSRAGFVRGLNICPWCRFENHRPDRSCKACGELLAGAPARAAKSTPEPLLKPDRQTGHAGIARFLR
jgi:hypothetical protein